MTITKKTFNQLRETYLVKLKDRKDLSDEQRKEIADKVTKLQDRDYKVIGYGSLLNINDVYRTSPNLVKHEVGYLNGWTRIFNMGNTNTGSYLNVYPNDEQENMIVAILTIPSKDMMEFIEREINYRFVEVNVRDTDNEVHSAWMVLGYKENVKHNLIPQVNYLHLCMNGAGKLDGQKGITNFINSTETCFGPLKEFLQTPLEEIYRIQTYYPR
jgi:hypothetical protein